jgi:glutamine amidotransferase
MIALVDYGAGNLSSVRKALTHVGAAVVITSQPEIVTKADKIILPGVGHFGAIDSLEPSGMKTAIQQRMAQGVPFLGICLGMQWMFEGSQEAPQTRGAGVLAGECQRFPATVKSPHVGWNALTITGGSRLLAGVVSGSFVYFTHSYRAPVTHSTSARCDYGGEFSAAVEQDHVFGVQFHPEKSGAAGLQVLRNFCELAC